MFTCFGLKKKKTVSPDTKVNVWEDKKVIKTVIIEK